MAGEGGRTPEYARISSLESLLTELNTNLTGANNRYLTDVREGYPKIFLVGPHRSGSTLFLQWLARTGLVAYPTNLLSRFYGAPLVGARIQQLLTDPEYNFRNEIVDFSSEIGFSSENGKTRGALAPNEFWYFWRRFLPFEELDFGLSKELQAKGNLDGLRDELNALANLFEKPLAMKAMIMNQNIPDLAAQFENALFVWLRRDPVFNIQSALEARIRQYGNLHTWYSFRIREYPQLKDLEPLESVAGQIEAINRSVEQGFASLPENRRLVVDYEDFCERPEHYFNEIVDWLLESGGGSAADIRSYTGEARFANTNLWRLTDYTRAEAEQAYRVWTERNQVSSAISLR